MIDTNRLATAAETLRTMAANPANLDVDKLLSLAEEIDQIHHELPSQVDFISGVLFKYKSKN